MSDLPREQVRARTPGPDDGTPRRRRRRADADRSRAAIVQAAIEVLDAQPDAGLERIAETAGVTRQTVYAHFTSRDMLLTAVVDELTREFVSALDALPVDDGSTVEAVLRLIDLGWRAMETHPLLLHLPGSNGQDERHDPIVERLDHLIRRGRRAGEITRDLPVGWLVSTTIALGHAAGESVASGRLTSPQAAKSLRITLRRLLV